MLFRNEVVGYFEIGASVPRCDATRGCRMDSRVIDNHAAAVALHYFAHHFIKIHRALRVTPAMAAGVTDKLWDVSNLVDLWEAEEAAKGRHEHQRFT